MTGNKPKKKIPLGPGGKISLPKKKMPLHPGGKISLPRKEKKIIGFIKK